MFPETFSNYGAYQQTTPFLIPDRKYSCLHKNMAKRGEKAVSLGEKLRKQQYDAIWKEYCGFLDLTMQDYMKIQNRLMEEQIQLWSDCELGKSILGMQEAIRDRFHGCSLSL